MIVVKLIGGLGNQMFQYAIGRRFAIKNKTTLSLDLTTLLNHNSIEYTPRNFELDIFNIKYSKLINKPSKSFIDKFYNKFFTENINEVGNRFNENIMHKKGNIYLDGFWQNENYFKDIEQIIREDFIFKSAPDEANSQTLKHINEVSAVSIHFRRGDYITNKLAVDHHGICEPDYYLNAINKINKTVDEPHFFIFSDDITWVKENFNTMGNTTFVSHNSAENGIEDMRLMAACKHNIIANSSFSWWGAWLNINPHKTVIAPKKWFKNLETDVIPSSWLKI